MKTVPAQVWRLMVAYALMMAGTSLMVLIAGIIGTKIAPSPALSTLPVALTIVGLAFSAAAGHQYRFAAMESVPSELAVRGQDLLATEFAGFET